jgi:hypothetical protein
MNIESQLNSLLSSIRQIRPRGSDQVVALPDQPISPE